MISSFHDAFLMMKAWDLANREQFHQYILLCIGKMSASTLRLGKGLGTNKRPYERLHQVEWYSSGTANAGFGAISSPDVGAVSPFVPIFPLSLFQHLVLHSQTALPGIQFSISSRTAGLIAVSSSQ